MARIKKTNRQAGNETAKNPMLKWLVWHLIIIAALIAIMFLMTKIWGG